MTGPAVDEAHAARSSPPAGADRTRDGGAEMFDTISRRYDLLNRVLSAGMDGGWRRRAIRTLDPQPDDVILDLCTGTGDFGIEVLKTTPARVVGLDIAREMMRIGHQKVGRLDFDDRFFFGEGDAENLPLPDASINGALIAFGIRNVVDRGRALRELARVIRPGGRLVILEFGVPRSVAFRGLYFFYFRQILPVIGGLLSGHRRAYEYLPESVRNFPSPNEFRDLCIASGFAESTSEPLMFGIVNLYRIVR